MYKTIEQWFKQSTELWASEALMWAPEETRVIQVESLADAVLVGFVWEDTYHGYDFWEEIYNSIHTKENIDSHNQELPEWISFQDNPPLKMQAVLAWSEREEHSPFLGYLTLDGLFYARVSKEYGSIIQKDSLRYPQVWYPVPHMDLSPPIDEDHE